MRKLRVNLTWIWQEINFEIKDLTSVLRRFPVHWAAILWLWVTLVSWLDWVWPRGSRRVVWVTRVGLVSIDWISLVRLCRVSLRRVSLRRISLRRVPGSAGRGVSWSGGARPGVGGRLLVIHLHTADEGTTWKRAMKLYNMFKTCDIKFTFGFLISLNLQHVLLNSLELLQNLYIF